jgi:AcrR family transcriptional regulator
MGSSLSAAELPVGTEHSTAWAFAHLGARPGGIVAQDQSEDSSGTDGRKAATQARILSAARALFAEHGFERTTIAMVASESGVSRAAVFWHFGDKANLFQESCRELLIPFLQELGRSIDDADPRERMLVLLSVYEEFVEKNRETIETFVRWVLESPSLRATLQKQLFELHGQFARDMRGALTDAIGDSSQAPALAAALVSLLDGNLLLSFMDPDPEARRLRHEGLRAISTMLLGDSAKP